MEGRGVLVGALGLAALVSAPLIIAPRYDSFPLSTYPMFSSDRASTVSLPTVVGIRGERVVRLSPQIIGGSDEVILAVEAVADAVGAGDEATAVLCEEVARRAAAVGLDAIEVVTERYDLREYFERSHEPLDRTVHARCESPR